LSVLKSDKSAIFKAAAEASRALDYLIDLQPSEHALKAARPDYTEPRASRAARAKKPEAS
jgi:antirestriction protein ArdC